MQIYWCVVHAFLSRVVSKGLSQNPLIIDNPDPQPAQQINHTKTLGGSLAAFFRKINSKRKKKNLQYSFSIEIHMLDKIRDYGTNLRLLQL